MRVLDRQIKVGEAPQIYGCMEGMDCDIILLEETGDTAIYEIRIDETDQPMDDLHIKWKVLCAGCKRCVVY